MQVTAIECLLSKRRIPHRKEAKRSYAFTLDVMKRTSHIYVYVKRCAENK